MMAEDMATATQTTFFGEIPPPVQYRKETTRSGTFVDNMKLPVHRWFRYSAGFSAQWVESEIGLGANGLNVFDPFAGSGTTLLAAESVGANALGQEAHPFVFRVGNAKLAWATGTREFLSVSAEILRGANHNRPAVKPHKLLSKCYDENALSEIAALHSSLMKAESSDPSWKLCWLAFVAILRTTSHAGTAQWQYLLPNKTKSRVTTPLRAFEAQVLLMTSDMETRQRSVTAPGAKILLEDCREAGQVPDDWADIVITSPPYINNYDYADATRLEMTVLGEINGWGDLQNLVRTNLVRSCTQHIAPYAKDSIQLIKSDRLSVIVDELRPIVEELSKQKELHGGKKNYDSMVVHYFYDMAAVWCQLRRIARRGSRVCVVLGDSAPYGVYVPVDRWHGELAKAAGFKDYEFKKLRDRNMKWKNRKHRIPLQEGQLWLNG
jgi:hypothetical protein